MNAIENMHEVRFLSIYILSHIIYYILPLTIIIVLAIKAKQSVFQTSVNFSVTYLLCIMVISKIKYELFYLDFLLFQTKKSITSWLKRWKEKQKNIEFISRFKYALKVSPLKNFDGCFFDPLKNSTICSAFNNPWKMENFWWTTNPL